VVNQAARAQRTARGMTPGHHLLLHLKGPCIRILQSGNGEKTNPREAVKPEITRPQEASMATVELTVSSRLPG
jgi:hypothetical protein